MSEGLILITIKLLFLNIVSLPLKSVSMFPKLKTVLSPNMKVIRSGALENVVS